MKAGYANLCKMLNKSLANLEDSNKSLLNLRAICSLNFFHDNLNLYSVENACCR